MAEKPPNSSAGRVKKVKKVVKKVKKVKKAKKKRVVKPKRNLNEPYVWLLKQLKERKNQRLTVQRSAALLESILGELKLEDEKVISFLKKVKTDMNLKEIMQYFKVKRNKK